MSRPSDSRSKSIYQGQVIKRAHRSEYDDTKLRDLARHDARLDNDLKSVERARTVMKKSMEADKQLFIKANSQNNALITKSKTSNARLVAHVQATSSAAQHSRLVSDTRVKRSSTSDNEPPDLHGLKVEGASRSRSTRSPQSPTVTSSGVTSAKKASNDNNNNKNPDKTNGDVVTNGKLKVDSTSTNPEEKSSTTMKVKGGKSPSGTTMLSTDAILEGSDSIYDSFFSSNTVKDPTTVKDRNGNTNSPSTTTRKLTPKAGSKRT